MTSLTAGPADGTLTLHTGVEGRAAKLGHALTIALSDWSATAELDGEALTSVEVVATLSSLSVASGTGGVKPLSDKDKASIRDNALETLKVGAHPTVRVTSTSITPTTGGYDVAVQVSVAGVDRPAVLAVTVAPEQGLVRVNGITGIVQTEHGLSPYSAMMGGLKVSDRVEVRLDVTVAR